MKKSIFVIAIMIAMLFVVQKSNAQTATFNFQATVEKYIAVSATQVDVNLAGSWNQTRLNPGTAGSQNLVGFPQWKTLLTDNVYANCPFSVTYAGADGNFPILSRTEINGNGDDRLQTSIVIRNEINGSWGAYQAGHEIHDMSFVSDAEGANTGTYTNQSIQFTETPHNGEVRTEIFMSAALPHLSPDFGNANSWNQSADAGLYTCKVIATYAAIM